MAYHFTTSVWMMPPTWHWTGHSTGCLQQADQLTEVVQADQ